MNMIPTEILVVIIGNVITFGALIWYCANLRKMVKKDVQKELRKSSNKTSKKNI